MHEAIQDQPPPPQPPPAPAWPGVLHGLAVWLVIAGLVSFFAYKAWGWRIGGGENEPAQPTGGKAGARLQGRFLVAARDLEALSEKTAVQQARETFKDDPPRRAVLLGELSGPEEALQELKGSDADEARLLRRLYMAKRPGALSGEEQALLRERLGWFGELALASVEKDGEEHADLVAGARQAAVALFAIFGFAAVGVFVGVFLLMFVVGLAAAGRITPTVKPGRSLVYAESFALYLAAYLGLTYLASWVVALTGLKEWAYGLAGAAMLLSLTALAWPLLRGVAWAEVCEDIGLSTHSAPQDILAGVGTYAAALPLVFAGIIVVVLAFLATRRLGLPLPLPSHPVGGMADGSSPWWVWAQVIVAASVLAPLVEEIFFRGVLYTHLRRISMGASPLLSFFFSALASGFVFAIIHPQGPLGLPVLGALATTFCLAREVRGSLLPGMVAHGINNFVAMLLLMFVLS